MAAAATPVRIAVLGAGTIGRAHVARVQRAADAELIAIVDPSAEAKAFAEAEASPWYPSLETLLANLRPDGVIVATPNRMHVANGLACVEARIPALIEKPLADDVIEATTLVDAAELARVTLLVGHHRRHNPLIQAAKTAIDAGRIGRVVAVHATTWFHKADAYFDVAWRREPGAGPVIINLIHDLDLLRYLCGPIDSVQAIQSNAVRGYAVEDSAAILLRFASGALGTMTVSDTIAAPWSWEMTSGENTAFHQTDQASIMIGGTHGSLSIPHLELWTHHGPPSWWTPIAAERLAADEKDPLALQIDNFCAVIRDTAAPLVPAREGLETLKIIAAVKHAALTGGVVMVG